MLNFFNNFRNYYKMVLSVIQKFTYKFLNYMFKFLNINDLQKSDLGKNVYVEQIDFYFEDKIYYKYIILNKNILVCLLFEEQSIYKNYKLNFVNLKYPAYCYFIVNMTNISIIDVEKHVNIGSENLHFYDTFDKFFVGQ